MEDREMTLQERIAKFEAEQRAQLEALKASAPERVAKFVERGMRRYHERLHADHAERVHEGYCYECQVWL
jgi:hypothetical protein